MRKLILLSLVALFIPLALAIDVGQNLTQQQVNSIDFMTVSLQCRNNGISIDVPNFYVFFDLDCLSLIYRNETNKYEVIRQSLPQYYQILEYLTCRAFNNKPYCLSEMRNTVLYFFRSDKLSLRYRLRDMQTLNTDFTPGDINVTEVDLNG